MDRPSTIFASYVLLFVALDFPWVLVIDHAVPREGWMGDAGILVLVLGWVTHALATAPARLYELPINFPSRAQLTGSEHLLSAQLAFAPVYALTGNAVLGANVVALLSYPLAALSMERLLRALGCVAATAWIGGLLFALGPERVPATLHTLQYPNFFLPLTALTLRRLRERPGTCTAAALGVVVGLGVFMSYYTALLLLLAGAIWALLELLRPIGNRGRFVVLAAVAVVVPLGLLAVFSIPFFSRAATLDAELDLIPPDVLEHIAALRRSWLLISKYPALPGLGTPLSQLWWGPAALALLALGLVTGTLLRGRRLLAIGLLYTLIGGLLMLDSEKVVFGTVVRLPFALFAASPLRFFRDSSRFSILAGFGTTLIAVGGLESAWRMLPGTVRWLAPALAGAALAVTGVLGLPATPFVEVRAVSRDAAVYSQVVEATRQSGSGPLLTLPFERSDNNAERLIAITRHWQPSILSYTGYPPAQQHAVREAIAVLPDSPALEDLVDMTHLRWLLLRPADDQWTAAERADMETRLVAQGGVRSVPIGGRWALYEVTRPPTHAAWFDAVATGPRPGRTLLGTPIAALPPKSAVARLEGSAPLPWAGLFTFRAKITNLGTDTWPAAFPPGSSREYAVELVAEWLPEEGSASGAPRPERARVPLRRDLLPGETISQQVSIGAPAPGGYTLSLVLEQRGGPPFLGDARRRWPIIVQ